MEESIDRLSVERWNLPKKKNGIIGMPTIYN